MAIIATGHITITDVNDGIGVLFTKVLYFASTSNQELIDAGETGWSEEAPAWSPGIYIWTKTVVVYDDEDVAPVESQPACITGNHGDDGNGVASVEAQYYLSESNSEQVGGEWLSEAPAWEMNKYIWTRTKITYTKGEPSYTEPYCDSAWEAVNYLKIGGRNYIQFSRDMIWEDHYGIVVITVAYVGSAIVGTHSVG